MFVSPNKSELEIGRTDAVLERIRPHSADRFVSFVYEDVCCELFRDMCSSGKIPFEPSRVGSFYGRGDVEIDVAAVDHSKKKLFAGECKFYADEKIVETSVYADLQKNVRCRSLPDMRLCMVSSPQQALKCGCMNSRKIIRNCISLRKNSCGVAPHKLFIRFRNVFQNSLETDDLKHTVVQMRLRQ